MATADSVVSGSDRVPDDFAPHPGELSAHTSPTLWLAEADTLKFLRGLSIPFPITGPRNAGAPTFADVVGQRIQGNFPLHASEMSSILPDKVREIARDTPLSHQADLAMDFITSVRPFATVPKPILGDSTCTLDAMRTLHMINIGFWELLPDQRHARDVIKGIASVFTISEIWKTPPRDRVITWTKTTNLDLATKPHMSMIRQCDVRHLVHRGLYGFAIDGKQCYNQFELDELVSYYQCVNTPLGWCRIKRLSMGCRQACFVADTVLKVLGYPCTGVTSTYIDNFLDIGQTVLQCEQDLKTIVDRSATINYVWNEPLIRPDGSINSDLIKQRVEYLGLELNLEPAPAGKKVRLTEKTLNKLATVWSRRDEWTNLDFVVCVCVLVYRNNVLGKSMSQWQPLLQTWARMQSDAMRYPDQKLLKLRYVHRPDLMLMLSEWVLEMLLNQWEDVPEDKSRNHHDFVLITDACVIGWGGILISTATGQCTVMGGEWPEHIAKSYNVGSSAEAEPLAVVASMNTFFKEHAKASVLHVGDNVGTTGQINKGYSTKAGQILMPYLAACHPHLNVDSDYYPGKDLPADEISRRLELVLKKLDTLAKHYGVDISSIRDLRKF